MVAGALVGAAAGFTAAVGAAAAADVAPLVGAAGGVVGFGAAVGAAGGAACEQAANSPPPLASTARYRNRRRDVGLGIAKLPAGSLPFMSSGSRTSGAHARPCVDVAKPELVTAGHRVCPAGGAHREYRYRATGHGRDDCAESRPDGARGGSQPRLFQAGVDESNHVGRDDQYGHLRGGIDD